jgi:hypothetical protein
MHPFPSLLWPKNEAPCRCLEVKARCLLTASWTPPNNIISPLASHPRCRITFLTSCQRLALGAGKEAGVGWAGLQVGLDP